MRVQLARKRGILLRTSLLLAAMLLIVFSARVHATPLPNLIVTGVDLAGNETAITAYRWLVEEDKTYHVQTDGNGNALPTSFDPNWAQGSDSLTGGETLAVGFHQSYMPVVAKGCVGFGGLACNEVIPGVDGVPALDPTKNYYVSVVPRSGASIGGASYSTTTGATVYVSEHPIPTAQITIVIYEDNNPINNAIDLPPENSAINGTDMSGFTIVVEDAGGRYGASAGVQSTDAFGNPLGTTYDVNGDVTGYQPLITGPDGHLTVKNLAPGKYGIIAVPPGGEGWQQTSTIEGTRVIDAWVKANEPPFFAEFGPAGFHAAIGFVKPFSVIPAGGTATLTGTVVNNHLSRPPEYAFFNGACFGHTTPWIGLNSLGGGGIGTGIYAAATDENCNFSIPNVPDGNYQLVAWDNNLDVVFAFLGVSIVGGQCIGPDGPNDCTIGEVPVFQWFHRVEQRVFDDLNANGIWDVDETPSALESAFLLRWRDGTVYQENVSDGVGAFTFDQVFPFFSWLVTEVDFARFQATGLTVVVDNGGEIPDSVFGPAPLDDNDITFGRAINPQNQTNPNDAACTPGIPGTIDDVCNEGLHYRVEHGPVLTQGFQGFLGQTNAFLWGKRHYQDLCEDGTTVCTTDATLCAGIGAGTCGSIIDNGGVSGIVFYAITRAENNPEYAAAEPWEPGIPGVIVNLYESLGVDPDTGVAIKGNLLNTTTTDSWDDSIPTGCKYGNGITPVNVGGTDTAFAWTPDGDTFYATDCYDGLRNFNQARPAVFDGGYAFDEICVDVGGMNPDLFTCNTFFSPMPVGDYIVEVIPPTGYETLKPEDKNVDFGDEYVPAPALLPPPCVGDQHLIPDFLTLFPDEGIEAPFAGTNRPLCDRKLVPLSEGANAAADFFLFTEVPVAAHGVGFILDDTQNEFDPNSPNFGEKYAPPFVPIAIRDWTGRVIGQTISDQFGRYNFLAPSTITNNLPQPSGISPNMLTACMNDPGDDPDNPDPNWNQLYSTFCYTFQYMPGATTYLDTPVVPVAAFAGPDQFPLDCEFPDGTPRIASVDVQANGVGGGPYIPVNVPPQTGRQRTPTTEGLTIVEHTILITSMGSVAVANPNYCNPAAGACADGADLINKTITRDYGFGDPGTVTLGGDTLVCAWGDPISCSFPAVPDFNLSQVGGRQLVITRANGQVTKTGVTVQVGLRAGAAVRSVSAGGSIQAAIDAAQKNDLILVGPGNYNEMVVMWKPVQLQGWGAGATVINAINAPAENLQDWRLLVNGLVTSGAVDLLPGQGAGLDSEEGAGIFVLAKEFGPSAFGLQNQNGPRLSWADNQDARIDGFSIISAGTGGGIMVNGYGDYLDISNNRIANNTGFFGGGIRVGHPQLVDGETYTDSDNDYVSISHNQIVFNGGLDGAGGGISMNTGSDFYQITQNWVCGNFSLKDAGGIGHYGLSDSALINNNTIIFNESFFQGQTVSGGGIFISGAAPLTLPAPAGPAILTDFSEGAGNVDVLSNLIQGNSAGAGDGGGIRLARINGQDVFLADADPNQWYGVNIINNMIVNNVAALAGGGISLQDAVKVNIQHNTIANNDSLAVAGEAFAPGSPNQSTPQPGAGIVSRAHSALLTGTGGAGIGAFSDPDNFLDNIIFQNRQFFFRVETGTPGDSAAPGIWGLCPDIGSTITGLACPGGNDPVFDDLGVIGTTGDLSDPSNLVTPGGQVPPSGLFVAEYFNGNRSSVIVGENPIQPPPAFDEGGNFIRARYGPLALYNDSDTADPPQTPNDGDPGILYGDYHIVPGSAAQDNATETALTPATDFDGDARPLFGAPDTGADESTEPAPAPAAIAAPASIIPESTNGNGSKTKKTKKPRRQRSERTR